MSRAYVRWLRHWLVWGAPMALGVGLLVGEEKALVEGVVSAHRDEAAMDGHPAGKGIPQGLKPLVLEEDEKAKPEGLAYLEANSSAALRCGMEMQKGMGLQKAGC